MAMKNKYAVRSRLSEPQFRRLVRLFSLDLDATQIAELTGLNRNTVNRYLRGIRIRIAEFCQVQAPFVGEIEVDESFFGPRRVKGRRGRGAFGKTAVFGVFKRNGCVYTEIVPDCSKATLQAIIRGRVELSSVIYTDGWRGYNGLVDVGYGKHLRVDHSKDEFARGRAHINGIEGFWGFAKSRLTRFRGMNKQTFYHHLKECEFRFNHRREDIYPILLRLCRQKPLN
ncbi:MAG: IS1595 family transposase [Thioalkalivibrio sp.]